MLLVGLFLSGCETAPPDQFEPLGGGTTASGTNAPSGPRPQTSELIQLGDSLTIVFSDTPTLIPPFDARVSEDGTITLIENMTFSATNKNRGDLEKEIRKRYVPDYFVRLTVTIKPQDRLYFVDGEVKAPGRQIYIGPTTVLKAIASCGGFTDYAKKTKVKLIHADDRIQIINCVKALVEPRLDVEVFPGDKINVPRRYF